MIALGHIWLSECQWELEFTLRFKWVHLACPQLYNHKCQLFREQSVGGTAGHWGSNSCHNSWVMFMIWALNLGPVVFPTWICGSAIILLCLIWTVVWLLRYSESEMCLTTSAPLWMLYLWRWGKAKLAESKTSLRKQCWEFQQACVIKRKAGSSKIREAFNHAGSHLSYFSIPKNV